MSDFQWNIDLDPKLFDPTPPEGYTEAASKHPLSLEEQVQRITKGLTSYAKLTGGHYPHVEKIDADAVRAELCRRFGIKPDDICEEMRNELKRLGIQVQPGQFVWRPAPEGKRWRIDMSGLHLDTGPLPPGWERMEKLWRIEDSYFALWTLAYIQGRNPDAAYYGKTVGPKDKDKVLFRWKLGDGKYEVIFGDLRSETVTAERLRFLTSF
jgi:hypothetical protein